MTPTIPIALFGASGRMGRSIVSTLAEYPELELVGALAGPGGEGAGQDAGALAGIGELGVALSLDRAEVLGRARVAIDFTLPAAVPDNLAACVRAGVACVSGVTGLDDAARAAMDRAAERVPLLWAANMSMGVTVLLRLAEIAAAALQGDFDAEILEIHHAAKRDAPSGTALAVGAAVARGRGLDERAAAVFGRHGDAVREPGSIGYASLRGGDVVGEHTLVLAGRGERLEVTHRATDRRIFARGALRAAAWLAGRPPRRYAPGDVFGL